MSKTVHIYLGDLNYLTATIGGIHLEVHRGPNPDPEGDSVVIHESFDETDNARAVTALASPHQYIVAPRDLYVPIGFDPKNHDLHTGDHNPHQLADQRRADRLNGGLDQGRDGRSE